jgi:D-alanyl-D-alanine carboxypeptidase (penicillin-binding protein 5/6)
MLDRRGLSNLLRAGVIVTTIVGVIGALSPLRARAASAPHLGVTAAILVAPGTGQELYGVQAGRELPIASTTKLMTALLTLEHARLGKLFVDPNYYPAPADSQIGLVPGERMSVHDLLLALLLPSADDAAEDLAYNVGRGSVARFIAMMNVRARQLGLAHTHYSTPIGLDTPGNYSTASDLVKLTSYLLKTQPFFARAVALRSAVLHTGDRVRIVTNRNDLVGRVPWINGVKTGHTIDAGYVLVASGRRDGMTLLSVVLGTTSEAARDANTLALLGYGFENFRLITPVRAGAVIARPTIRDRPGKRASVIAARTFTRVIESSTRLKIRLELPHELAGPLPRHAAVGTVLVLANGRTIARIRLLLARALQAVSPFKIAARFMTRPSTLVSLLVLFGAAIVLALRRRDRARQRGEEGAEPA